MEQLKKPIWLLVSFIFPMILLIFLFNETYQIIESLLTSIQKDLWATFGYYFSILIALCAGYSGYLILKKKSVDFITAWVVLFINILNITLYFFFIDEVLPNNIPDWMFTSSDLTIYPYSFLIPGALYAMILLVLKYTPEPESKNAYVNLVPIIAIPLFVSAASVGLNIFNVYRYDYFSWLKYIPIFLMVFLTCVFLFYLVRFMYIMSIKGKRRDVLALVLKIAFTCVFPVAGLYFNNEIDWARGGIFGNFQHPLFYILSITNGIILCLPETKNVSLRWLVFVAKSSLFAFILYFFFIFLPFLPLSVLAILAVGFGFLMLAPIIIFVYQLASLRNDIRFLAESTNKMVIYGVFALSFMVLPTVITINYKMDRSELDRIFTFLYDRSYDDDKVYSFDPVRVDRMLNHIHDVKSTGINHSPFLDSYYNWIVLDNLLLSDKKLDQISSVLNGDELNSKHPLFSWFTFPTKKAYLKDYTIESNYNGNHWTSYVHLEVASNENFDTEFRMFLNTPNDCFISNYYLEIEGEREYGILAEKKSANWAYNNIVKTKRDPGILNSVGHNKYQLKVFPVQQHQSRITGIEFVHKEPIEIILNDSTILLGDALQKSNNITSINNGQGTYISSSAKQSLTKTKRKPEYHIIIDRSAKNEMTFDDFENTIAKLKEGLPDADNMKIWAGNYNIQELSSGSWKEEIKSIEQKGGFYPEYQMKKVLIENYRNHSDLCPVFILITPSPKYVSMLNGFSDIMFTTPDIKHYYTCDEYMNIDKNELESGKFIKDITISDINWNESYTYEWNNNKYYLPVNNDADYIAESLKVDNPTKWQQGVMLNQELQYYAFNPDDETAWVDIVKSSMQSGIVSPFTSYLSLENEAQKKALLNKQKQVLESNENFDLEEAEPMSEPNVIWYILILLVGLFIGKRILKY